MRNYAERHKNNKYEEEIKLNLKLISIIKDT